MDWNAVLHAIETGGPGVAMLLAVAVWALYSGKVTGPAVVRRQDFEKVEGQRDRAIAITESMQQHEDERIDTTKQQLDLADRMVAQLERGSPPRRRAAT